MRTKPYTRNEACICGSGKKVKRCHPALIGQDPAWLQRRYEILTYWQGVRDFIVRQPGYVPPAWAGAAGWDLANFRAHGCPYVTEDGSPACNYGSQDDGICCSPGCGVGAIPSSLAPTTPNLVSNPV